MLKQIYNKLHLKQQHATLTMYNKTYIFCLQRMGTWKITAQYEGDEYVASREFKVQKFGKLISFIKLTNNIYVY